MHQCIKDFYDQLNSYKYCCCGPDMELHFPQDSLEWDRYNMVMNPDLFHQKKGGCCWDYCIAQHKFFSDNNIPCWSFCLLCEKTPFEVENNCTPTTHTFTIFKDENSDQYYYFEQSFKKKKGIYGPWNSLNEALYKTFDFLCRENPNKVVTNELHIHQPLNPNTYGMDSYDYFNYMQSEPLVWTLGEDKEVIFKRDLNRRF